MAVSETEKSGLNLTLVPVESLVFSGVQKSFLRIFGCPSVWCTSDDKVQAVSDLFQGRPVEYPYAFLTLNGWTEATERGNTKVSALRGHHAIRDVAQIRGYNVKFLPMDFEVSVEYVTNDYRDLLKFASNWMFARKLGWLKFQAAYGNIDFAVGSDMDGNIQFPVRAADPTNVSEYVLSTTMRVLGYVSLATLLEAQEKKEISVSLDLNEIDENGDRVSFWKFDPTEDKQLNQSSIKTEGTTSSF